MTSAASGTVVGDDEVFSPTPRATPTTTSGCLRRRRSSSSERTRLSKVRGASWTPSRSTSSWPSA